MDADRRKPAAHRVHKKDGGQKPFPRSIPPARAETSPALPNAWSVQETSAHLPDWIENCLHPVVNGRLHLMQVALEKVLRAINQNKLFGPCGSGNDLLEIRCRPILVARAADKYFGFPAVPEKVVGIDPALRGDRHAQCNDSHNPVVRTGGVQSCGCPERKSAEDDRQVILGAEPV